MAIARLGLHKKQKRKKSHRVVVAAVVAAVAAAAAAMAIDKLGLLLMVLFLTTTMAHKETYTDVAAPPLAAGAVAAVEIAMLVSSLLFRNCIPPRGPWSRHYRCRCR